MITLDRTYIRFRFKINLHIDDLQVLNIIKSNLNIGRIIVEEERSSCAFVVQNFSDLGRRLTAAVKKYIYKYISFEGRAQALSPYIKTGAAR